jgi:hypothetical protein
MTLLVSWHLGAASRDAAKMYQFGKADPRGAIAV